MREEFKEITDYPIYQVTSYGRIYNTILKKFRKLYLRKDGYFYVDLYNFKYILKKVVGIESSVSTILA